MKLSLISYSAFLFIVLAICTAANAVDLNTPNSKMGSRRFETIVLPQMHLYKIRDFKYITEIVANALESNENKYGPVDFEVTDAQFHVFTQLQELQKTGRKMNIGWGPIDKKNLKDFNAVQVPLFRGILGMRLLTILENKRSMFDAIRSADQVKKLRIAVGEAWEDMPILKKAGFNVVTSTQHPALFRMVRSQQADGVSRSVLEAYNEIEDVKVNHPGVAVDSKLLLVYPSDYFLYVPKTEPKLFERLSEGMANIVKSGKFKKIFDKYFQNDIKAAQLAGRLVVEIPNPDIPDEVLKTIKPMFESYK